MIKMDEKQMLEELEQVRAWTKSIDERCQRIIALLSNAKAVMNPEKAEIKEGYCTKCGKETGAKWKKLCIECWKEANPL